MNLFLPFVLVFFPFGCKSEFWRRRWHSAVVAQDWLYIDGGQVSSTQGNYVRENSTLGLDLSKDWTNTSLTLIRTERPRPAYSRSSQALWFDSERNVIYCFGGDNPIDKENSPPPFDAIWSFTPDGNGGGTWREAVGLAGEKPFPSDIYSAAFGMSAGDNNAGYYLGGFSSERTSPWIPEAITNSGLLRLDFETLTLTNSSGLDMPVDNGVMLNVPVFDSNGVLVAIGGKGSELGVGFDSINVYDKKERKWYSQVAEGDIPRPRSLFCAVAVHGKGHASAEIIIHGGLVGYTHGPEGEIFDEVYVLSLPAFRWFRANYTSTSPRVTHTCHATKNRQMIMIGGTNPLNSSDNRANGDRGGEPQDPWTQGIAVFDMTALELKDSYQSRADPYEPPYAIQQYYRSQ